MKHVNQQETPHYESSRLPYVCWYQNDFLGGVRGMRAHEIGIYTILLNEMYARGRPLEISEERLARLCGCDKRTFVNVLGMLIREGKILNLANGLWNARCENVFQEREKLLEQKSFAGRSSAKKRKKINTEIQQLLHARTKDDQQSLEAQKAEEEKETPNGVFEKNRVFDEKEVALSNQESLEQSAPPPTLALSASPTSSSLAETKHENGTATALQAGAREAALTALVPRKNTKKTANLVSSSFSTSPSSPCSNKKNTPSSIIKGHRLPEAWQADIKAAISEGLSESQAHWQAKKFRDYWQAKSGKEALKVDWQATWRNWFRREIERLEQQKQESVSPRPCASDENLYRSLINYSDDC